MNLDMEKNQLMQSEFWQRTRCRRRIPAIPAFLWGRRLWLMSCGRTI